jgi:hypothetical protein
MVKIRQAGNGKPGTLWCVWGSCLEQEKSFLLVMGIISSVLPHEESLSQKLSISYTYGNY